MSKTNGATGPRFVSLFSGCGGFDLGFAAAGFSCAAAFDIDPLAVAVHRRNLGSTAVTRDLTDEAKGLGDIKGVDVLLAGSPCQGFSTVGKRDPSDPRNGLLLTAGRIAGRVRPRVFIAENVAGVVSGEHRSYWDALGELLRAQGYQTTQLRCDATTMGVAQMRHRLVLLAWRQGWRGEVVLPSAPGGVLRDALAGLQDAPNHDVRPLAGGSRCAKIASHLGPGQKLCNVRSSQRAVHTWAIPEVFGRTNREERQLLEAMLKLRRRDRARTFGDADPVTARTLYMHLRRPVAAALKTLHDKGYVRKCGDRYDLAHTFNGKYRRLSWDAPSLTVDTRFGDPHYFLHPDESRGFTVREAARIQGFPDSFVFEGPERAQFRLVGNAVPPPMGKCLAEWVRANLLRG